MEGSSSSESGSGDFLEKLIAAFSTDKGSNLLTLAISVACKSSTTAWCEHQARQDAASAEAGRPDSLQRLFDFAGAPSLKPLAIYVENLDVRHHRARTLAWGASPADMTRTHCL